MLSEQQKKQAVDVEVKIAVDLYVELTNKIDDILRSRIVIDRNDIPPQVAQAIMLGSIAGCVAKHMSILSPDMRQWAAGAMQQEVNIDLLNLSIAPKGPMS